MNTLMARIWIAGMLLGLAYGFLSGGGITAILIMPLVGGVVGLLAGMFIDEARTKVRKRRR